MQIELNGETRTLDGPQSLADLVAQLELTGQRIAIEVNEELVPRSLYPQHQLSEGDRVEIVQAIGGG